MFKNLQHKLKKLFKKRKFNHQKYEELHAKLYKKLHKLDGKTDEKSKEEIFILKKTIEKVEKKLS